MFTWRIWNTNKLQDVTMSQDTEANGLQVLQVFKRLLEFYYAKVFQDSKEWAGYSQSADKYFPEWKFNRKKRFMWRHRILEVQSRLGRQGGLHLTRCCAVCRNVGATLPSSSRAQFSILDHFRNPISQHQMLRIGQKGVLFAAGGRLTDPSLAMLRFFSKRSNVWVDLSSSA